MKKARRNSAQAKINSKTKAAAKSPTGKKAAKVPAFSFVLDELSDLPILTKPMFGAHAVYHGDKIVLILREKESAPEDNGVWVATTPEHHASLHGDFPSMRSITLFGPGLTGWQVVPSDDESFEESALKLCELVRARDPRVGKIPGQKKKPAQKTQRTSTLIAKCTATASVKTKSKSKV